MPTMTKDELISAIEQMSVLELNELVKALETKFGVSAAAPVAVAAAGGGAAAAAAQAEEKTTFDVILKNAGQAQDRRHQGRPRSHRIGLEGIQGPGGRGPQAIKTGIAEVRGG